MRGISTKDLEIFELLLGSDEGAEQEEISFLERLVQQSGSRPSETCPLGLDVLQ